MRYHDKVCSRDMMKQQKSSGHRVGRVSARPHHHLIDITSLSPEPPCLSQNEKGFLHIPSSLTLFNTGCEVCCVQAASLCHAHAGCLVLLGELHLLCCPQQLPGGIYGGRACCRFIQARVN